ncbi:MAG: hypothetical protein JRI68_00700 [Deltaproteobacteria bacterium]|nr:hypothetical protein [Deltaproteobacteria bacterium]
MTSGKGKGDGADPDAGIVMPESWDSRHSDMARAVSQVPDLGTLRTTRPSRPPWVVPAIGAGVVAVLLVVVVLAWPDGEPEGPTKTVATATAQPARPAPPSPPEPQATASEASATATATATASVALMPPPAPDNPTLCFEQLMPPDAFGKLSVDVAYCCVETAAYGTTVKLKSEVVRAGGHGVSEAMKEWSQLGWYEMAAFAVMRTHCCPDSPALVVRQRKIERCQLAESLAWLANAIDDEEDMQQAVLAYTKAVRCITSKGYSESFGQYYLPQGGELTIFDRILQRILKLRKAARK